jgi:hypothetical protein
MEINYLQSMYLQAFNDYLNGIKVLLNGYSIREMTEKYPNIELSHIRLASELKSADTNVNPYCLHELRHMNNKDYKHWLRYIREHNTTPTQLRKLIRLSKKDKKKSKTKPDTTMRSVWLLQRKMKSSDDSERQRLIELINEH